MPTYNNLPIEYLGNPFLQFQDCTLLWNAFERFLFAKPLPIEIEDFPYENGDFHSYGKLPESMLIC
jgi:hypothetical protein